VALELPESVRSGLAEWSRDAVAGREGLRAVAPDALHVTLAFLGHVDAAEVPAIGAAVAGACSGLSEAVLRPVGVVAVPPRRPRLFAVDLEDAGGGAARVQAAVSEALAAGGWYDPERRPFWPHVTVVRVGRGAGRVPRLDGSGPPSEPAVASSVALLRSHLGRGPARYEALERVALRT
jgi:2'-5' RNA ligase